MKAGGARAGGKPRGKVRMRGQEVARWSHRYGVLGMSWRANRGRERWNSRFWWEFWWSSPCSPSRFFVQRFKSSGTPSHRGSTVCRHRGAAGAGQSTVEYAVVFAAFLALVVALGVIWRFLEAGTVVDHALQSASHHLSAVSSGAWIDVLLY